MIVSLGIEMVVDRRKGARQASLMKLKRLRYLRTEYKQRIDGYEKGGNGIQGVMTERRSGCISYERKNKLVEV